MGGVGFRVDTRKTACMQGIMAFECTKVVQD